MIDKVIKEKHGSWLAFYLHYKGWVKLIYKNDFGRECEAEVDPRFAKAKAFDELIAKLPEETVKDIIEQYNNLSK